MKNMRTEELRRHVAALQASGMLRHTQAQRRHAEEAIEPVPYFVIPSAAARSQRLGTIVTSFVHLDGRGILSLTAPKAYGVVERPTEGVAQHSTLRLQNAHVIAEDMALRRGIYTPYGRAAAELYVAERVAEPVNAATYVRDRVLHLGALAAEFEQEGEFRNPAQVVGELERGEETLRTYASDLGVNIE